MSDPKPEVILGHDRVAGEDDALAEPFALRDVSERLPNEALRSELETMTEDEQEAYLRHLEELSRQYLGPGGP
ncbi:MAG: hypothetical protein R2839_02665 [Thermomicrobiales bacterium]